jgi:hypothetical protein
MGVRRGRLPDGGDPAKLPSMKRALAIIILVGCGDGHSTSPDAAADAKPDAQDVSFTPECHTVTQPDANAYSTPSDFGPIQPGTLAGWDPDGRWFLTGVQVGPSSFFFERQGSQVIVDRDPSTPATFDDSTLFQRQAFTQQGTQYIVAKRVANRASDGSFQASRAVCDGGMCRVCTAKMIRATHNGDEGEGDHISLVGQLNDPTWGAGYTFNVRVAGTLAYLIRQDGLHIIETADPAHPVELGIYRRGGDGYSNDVKLVDAGAKRYAIIADLPVDVVDVTNPAAPQLVAQITEQAHTLALERRNNKVYAYFGNYDARCPIYDVTDPAHPMKLGTYQSNGQLVHDLAIENGIAYLNAWDAGFLVVDFTTPATPHLLGKFAPTPTKTSHSSWPLTAGGRHVALHGEEAYGAHLQVVDVDPASATFMQPISEYRTRDWVSVHNVMAFGTKAYFSYYQDGIRVMDMSDPTHPTLVGYYNTWDPQAAYTSSGFFEGAVGLDVDTTRGLIFVADSPRGLLILQDSTP